MFEVYNGAPALKQHGREMARKVIEGLTARGMKGLYYESKNEATEAVLGMIPEGATVGFGGSVTLHSLGIYNKLLAGPYQVLNRQDPSLTKDARIEVERRALTADYFVSGTNAITLDGRLVNIDGHGNRVAALLFGPKKVIIVCGVNKIVQTLEEAIQRVRQVACPLNAVRLGVKAQCVSNGSCSDCQGAQRLCRLVTVIEGQDDPERITVVLVGECLGF